MAPADVHLVSPPTAAELVADSSPVARWTSAWAADPGRRVLYDGCGGNRWVSAGELGDRTAAAVARLQTLGLGPGDRMLWSVATSVPAVVANLAALAAGLVVVPANPAYTGRELSHVLHDARPAVAVVDDPRRAHAVEPALARQVRWLGPDLQPAGGGGRGDLDGRSVGTEDAAPPGVALIGYTSGTTGVPKGAMLSHANLLASAEALRLAWGWTAEDRLVHALPIFHVHGLCIGLYATLVAGASAVLLPGFDVDAVTLAARRHGASMFFGVPTMYHRLAASGRVAELSSLRLAVSGSAPLPTALHGAMAAEGVVVLERYGLTETLMNTSNALQGDRRPGSVGACLPGVEAVVDDDGEVLVRGPNVGLGYWERPTATAEAWRGGWFHTGDLGSCDADGYLRLLGRAGDLIISGGYNVYPAEVEEVLAGFPGVTEVAVTGTPSDEWGEVVTAWVVVSDAVPEQALLEWAAKQLAPYKRPRLVRFVDRLPRTALGKVRRSELR